MQNKISPRTRGRYLAVGLLGMVALAGPAVGGVVTAAGKASFPITYGGDRFLGVFLGFDGDKQSPIVLGTPETIDVNGDGLEDVVFSATARSLAQESPLRARIFVSNGKTLKDKTKKLLSGTTQTMVARDLHVGDLNGDGKPDVFFSNHGPESITPFPGEQNRLLLSSAQNALTDASGTHLPQQVDFSHGSDIGDLDGDGDLDIFVPNLGSALNFPSNLLHNDGTGNFTVVATRDAPNGILPAGAPTRPDAFWSQICDMDGDGDLDIYISSSLSGPWPATIQYLVNGAGAFTYSAASIPNFPEAKGLPQDSACADIDRDGDDDVLLFNNTEGGGDYIQILINQGDGTLTDGSARIPSQKPGKSMPATSGAPFFSVIDLEGDGDPDFLVQRWNADFSKEVGYAFINDGTGKFSKLSKSKMPDIRPNFHALDINGDGILDFLSDETWQPAWTKNKKNQFRIIFGQLTTSVRRSGWASDDAIAGGTKKDKLKGNGGDDILRGNGGNDVLKGGPGDDVLIGGPGKDSLKGDSGIDHYRYRDLADSPKCPKSCDTIKGYQPGFDKIDLRAIDAKKGVKGNQAFNFVGRKNKFSGAKGELRYAFTPKGARLSGDVDGDKKADFEIQFSGGLELTQDDFLL